MKSTHRLVLLLSFLLGALSLAVAASGETSALLDRLDSVKEKVAAVRGLEFKDSVEAKSATKTDMTMLLLEELNEQLTTEDVDGFETSFEKFGVLPLDTDLMVLLVDLYSEEAAGLYDPREKRLWINEDVAGFFSEIALSHELTHALQDQHFDIISMPLMEKGEDDLVLATSAVLEGDASILMFEYFLGDASLVDEIIDSGVTDMMEAMLPAYGGALGDAPALIKAVVVFPYAYGMEFVQTVKKIGGWQTVNRLYRVRPLSTEQIMHPAEKFLENDPPVSVGLPDLSPLLGDGWEPLPTNVLGEFQLRVVLEELLGDPDKAEVVAAGWDGDRYQCYRGPDSVLLAWVVVWDTDEDAREFLAAYSSVLSAKYASQTVAESRTPDSYTLTDAGQASHISVDANQTIVLESLPESLLPEAEEVLWEASVTELPAADTSLFDEAELPADHGVLPPWHKPKGRIEGNRFISEQLGLEVSLLSADWAFLDELPQPLMAVGMVHNRSYAGVQIMAAPFGGLLSVRQLAGMVTAGMGALGGSYSVIDEGVAEIGGVEGYQVTAEIVFGKKQKVRQVLVEHAGTTFIITSSGYSEDFDVLSDEIASMERGIVFRAEGDPPQKQEASE